jgi:hypothetical protein
MTQTISKKYNKNLLGSKQLNVITNFFPGLVSGLKSTTDCKDDRYVYYPHQYLLMLFIFMFLFRLKSRRDISFDFNTPEFIQNTNKLLDLNLETVAHGDTAHDFLLSLDSEELKNLPRDLVKHLIRKRIFEKQKFIDKYYLIAIDGTGTATFSESLSGQELVRKRKNDTHLYFQYVLEAKFIFANGFVASVGSEFVENENGEFDKQDCERKACKRLIPILKKEFPCLKICLLLDGLYPNEPIITLCERNNWKYFITLKNGSLKTVHEDFKGLLKLRPENHIKYGETDIYWMNEIEYKGHTISIIKGIEQDEDNPGEFKVFMYITNFFITEYNVIEMYKTAKLRWKIENESFNTQKNDFNFEHLYSKNYDVLKSLYYLLQIAHMIFLIILYGYYDNKKIVKSLFGSMKNMAQKLFISYTEHNTENIFKRIRLSVFT